jgi:hypothetical protein
MLLLNSCATSKRSKPCTQCPHYTKVSALFLDKVKLNPYPHEMAYEKNN